MRGEDQEEETKQISKNTSRRRSNINISLKDIPPLVPSSIPRDRNSSSLKTRAMMVPKLRYQEMSDELKPPMVNSFSNIQIDPNSTRRSLNIITQGLNHPLPKPHVEEDSTSLSKDECKKGSAKSLLHEMCTSKRWKPPVYDCCSVDGPCHLRLFTYKVVVEIKDSSGTTTVLECFGDPKRKKKAAAEHAAEGALWYLDHVKGKSDKTASSTQMK